MSRTLRIGIYFICGVFFIVLFSFWMFPYEALEKRIESVVWKNFHFNLNIKEMDLSFPFGVKFYEMDITDPEKDYLTIQAQKGSVHFHPLMIFSNKLGMDLEMNIFEGVLNSAIAFSPVIKPENIKAKINWDGIQTKRIALLEKIDHIQKIQGRISGNATINYNFGQMSAANGQGYIKLANASFQMNHPSFSSIAIQALECESAWELKRRNLNVRTLKYQAKGMSGSLNGNILLHKNIPKSRVNINGDLDITQAHPQIYSLVRNYMHQNDFEFQIQGSVQYPEWSLKKERP